MPAKRTSKSSSKAKASSKKDKSAKSSRKTAKQLSKAQAKDSCYHCTARLSTQDRALFVEEEVGRVFCSEECIASFFAPEVARLEKEYVRHLSPSDLSGEEKEKLAHLRWITLEEPDEIWREKTLAGDHRYTLISEFRPGNKSVWSVCICLFLRGEPSFLYMAFPTKNAAMVNFYRRGEQVEWAKPSREERAESERQELQNGATDGVHTPLAEAITNGQVLNTPSGPRMMDGLADAWTEDETRRSQMINRRRDDDIQQEEYELYQACMEETLEAPDEVWTIQLDADDLAKENLTTDPTMALRLYHFIRQYSDEKPGYWYVIAARETEDEDEIEILDAFPTRDADLVESYRRGTQEVGTREEQPAQSRLVH